MLSRRTYSHKDVYVSYPLLNADLLVLLEIISPRGLKGPLLDLHDVGHEAIVQLLLHSEHGWGIRACP